MDGTGPVRAQSPELWSETQLEEWAHGAGTDFLVPRPGSSDIPQEQASDAEFGGSARPSFVMESGVRWGLNP